MRRPLKTKRVLSPDETYQSVKVTKLINYVLQCGQRETARQLVYGALKQMGEVTKRPPIEVFEEALKNAGPLMEIKTRRVGGANYQIPHEVTEARRLTLGLRWLVTAARARQAKPFDKRLADELLAASKNEGEAVKKRETVHKMAEANRAFAHFARAARPGVKK